MPPGRGHWPNSRDRGEHLIRRPHACPRPPPGCTGSQSTGRRSTPTIWPIRTRCAAQLRERSSRRFYAEEIGHVVVTRMEDIEAVFTQPDVFASTNVQDPAFPLDPAAAAILAAEDFDPIAVMSNRAEPGHARIRVHTRQGFSNRRLAALADYMRARASGLLEEMLAAGPPAEYVQAIAFPLPAEIVFRLLGFPAEDDALIKSWCVDRKAFSRGKPTAAEQVAIAQAMLDYWRYCRVFVASPARPAGRRLLLGAARRPRPRPGPGERHRHQLPGGRVGRLRDQLRRPRPRHSAPVQHASMFAAAT